jgi:Site-specific recombinases, DNA invertase Pin homologs
MSNQKRAVAYARYSSDNQREESITAQLKAIEEHCKRKGYVLVKIYTDEAKTATTDHREGFQQMITDSQKLLFDYVIVHKFDRFARNRYDSAFYKRQLRINNVRLESVLEQLDDSPESVILESILEGMAEYYSKNLSREVMKGMFENAAQGIHTGGRPPYGFKLNPETKKLEIDHHKASAVKIFFESLKNNISLQKIADNLNFLGFRTQDGKKFSKNSFYGWATNRKYIGDYIWNVSSSKNTEGKRNSNKKKPVAEQVIKEGLLPQIISPQLFEEVNSLMALRKHKPGTMKAKVNYLLVGKIFCGKCGAPYNGNSYHNSKNKDNVLLTYYKCSGKCGNTSIRKKDIENIAIDKLVNHCFSPEGMKDIVIRVNQLYQEQRKNSDNDIDPIRKELKELESQIENLIDALGKGIKGLEERIIGAQKRQELLQEQLLRIEIIKNNDEISETAIYNLLEQKKNLLLSSNDDEKKQVLQEYIEQIILNPSRDINRFDVEITYRVFNGGGEGNCTPVSKNCPKSIYACILYF